MRSLLVAAAVALFLGTVVTELFHRLFAGDYFALFILTSAAIWFGTMITLRSVGERATPASPGAAPPLETGHVKWFNRNKGFGFIVRDNGEEIFVHYRGFRDSSRRSLRDGQRVQFRVTESERGLQAEDVDVLSTS